MYCYNIGCAFTPVVIAMLLSRIAANCGHRRRSRHRCRWWWWRRRLWLLMALMWSLMVVHHDRRIWLMVVRKVRLRCLRACQRTIRHRLLRIMNGRIVVMMIILLLVLSGIVADHHVGKRITNDILILVNARHRPADGVLFDFYNIIL